MGYRKEKRDVVKAASERATTDRNLSITDVIGRGGADDEKRGDVKIERGIYLPIAIECPLALGSYQTGRTNESSNFIDAPYILISVSDTQNGLRRKYS